MCHVVRQIDKATGPLVCYTFVDKRINMLCEQSKCKTQLLFKKKQNKSSLTYALSPRFFFFVCLFFVLFCVFLALLEFVSRAAVMTHRRPSSVFRPLFRASRSQLHGPKPNYKVSCLSAVSRDLSIMFSKVSFSFTICFSFSLTWGHMPYGGKNVKMSLLEQLWSDFNPNVMIKYVSHGGIQAITFWRPAKVLWHFMFVNIGPYAAGNFKMLFLLQLSSDLRQTLR